MLELIEIALLKEQPWRTQAACRDADVHLFFMEAGDAKTFRAACAYCKVCPVRAECLEYAVARPNLHGIWAGTTHKKRSRMRGKRVNQVFIRNCR